jgi:hypothetical protein
MIDEAERIWSLMDEFHRGKRMPEIVLRRSENGWKTTGRAWPWKVVVTMGSGLVDACVVLIHELAHSAVGSGHGHDEVWADCYVKAARARWGTEHFEGVRASRGYAVDRYVAPAVDRAMRAHGLVPDDRRATDWLAVDGS